MKRKFVKMGADPNDEFEMLLFVLTQEVSFARLHLEIARGLAAAPSDKPRILHCAQTFFAFTFRAHLESAYARAARIFDRTTGTVTIPSMLRSAEKRAGKFQFATPADLRKRLVAWEQRIVGLQPLLAKLGDLRNGLIAHLDEDILLDPKQMSQTIGVTFDEIDQVLKVANELVTGVLDAYNSSTYVDALLSGDYEALFRILEESTRASIRSQKRSWDEKIARRAYEIYVERGENGNDVQDWLRAEQDLLDPAPRKSSSSDS